MRPQQARSCRIARAQRGYPASSRGNRGPTAGKLGRARAGLTGGVLPGVTEPPQNRRIYLAECVASALIGLGSLSGTRSGSAHHGVARQGQHWTNNAARRRCRGDTPGRGHATDREPTGQAGIEMECASRCPRSAPASTHIAAEQPRQAWHAEVEGLRWDVGEVVRRRFPTQNVPVLIVLAITVRAWPEG